jgi:hypothetical protein
MNPNTGTCPVFRSQRDMEITLGIYRRVPVLLKEGATDGNPWGVKFQLMFMMNTDSDKFRTHEDLIDDGWHLEGNTFIRAGARMLPLYEGKMLHHYDSRFSTYENATDKQLNKGTLPRFTVEQHQDPHAVPLPRYWVPEQDVPTGEVDESGQEIKTPGVRSRLAAKGWNREWVMGWREICRASDERTMITSVAPAHGFGNKFPLVFSSNPALLTACLTSFALDYSARQSLGGTSMSFFVARQLPVPTPDMLAPHAPFITSRLLELTYTSHDMTSFARDLGDAGAPFRWDPDRRVVIRAELDALFFHLYGIDRDDTAYILDTFNVTRDNDVKAHGEYRTKNLILAEYDRMAAAGLTLETPLAEGESGTYRSTLTPPPGQGPRHD